MIYGGAELCSIPIITSFSFKLLFYSTTQILTVTFLAHHKIASPSSKEHGESTPYVIQ